VADDEVNTKRVLKNTVHLKEDIIALVNRSANLLDDMNVLIVKYELKTHGESTYWMAEAMALQNLVYMKMQRQFNIIQDQILALELGKLTVTLKERSTRPT